MLSQAAMDNEVIAGLVGAAGILAATWLSNRFSKETKAEAVRFAVFSEIASVLYLVEKREYILKLNLLIASLDTNAEAVPVQFRITQPYFKIFMDNSAELGFLGPYAEPCIRFYHCGFSIMEELDILNQNSEALLRKEVKLNSPWFVKMQRMQANILIDLFTEFDDLGRDVLQSYRRHGFFKLVLGNDTNWNLPPKTKVSIAKPDKPENK